MLFVALHWTADPNVEARTDTVAKAIRYLANIHADYLRSRRYSIGYSVAIDQAGNSYELRGTRFRPAATLGRLLTRQRVSRLLDPDIGLFRDLIPDSARNGNRHTVAVLFLCGHGGPSPAAQLEAARFVDWCQRQAGRRLEMRPHSFFDPTGCPGDVARGLIGEDDPGDPLRRLIDARAWAPVVPTPTPPPPTDEETDVLGHQYHRRRYDSRPGKAAGGVQGGRGEATTHVVRLADGPCSAGVNVTAVDSDPGHISVAGGPDRERAFQTSATNLDPDGVTRRSTRWGHASGRVRTSAAVGHFGELPSARRCATHRRRSLPIASACAPCWRSSCAVMERWSLQQTSLSTRCPVRPR